MLAAGSAKLGWLSTLDAAAVKVNFARSVILKVFAIERCCILYPGPSSTNAPELPSVPGAGKVKQPGSNQCVTLRWSEGRLPLQARFGRPPTVLVLDRSTPEYDGEKNIQVCRYPIQYNCHPPSTPLMTALAPGRK